MSLIFNKNAYNYLLRDEQADVFSVPAEALEKYSVEVSDLLLKLLASLSANSSDSLLSIKNSILYRPPYKIQ